MTKVLRERDSMTCRACGNEERASEGYPCADCGTFICLPCSLRGVVRCRSCAERLEKSAGEKPSVAEPPVVPAPSPTVVPEATPES
jgi:ribosomal protein S27E